MRAREYGHRIVAYDVGEDGKPHVNLNKTPAVATNIVSDWTRLPGVRPMGRPASPLQGEDGAIWFVDDKARTVMVMLRCDGRPSPGDERTPRAAQIAGIASPPEWASLYQTVLRPRCKGCHEEMRNNDANDGWQELVERGLADPEVAVNSAIVRRMLAEAPGHLCRCQVVCRPFQKTSPASNDLLREFRPAHLGQKNSVLSNYNQQLTWVK